MTIIIVIKIIITLKVVSSDNNLTIIFVIVHNRIISYSKLEIDQILFSLCHIEIK